MYYSDFMDVYEAMREQAQGYKDADDPNVEVLA